MSASVSESPWIIDDRAAGRFLVNRATMVDPDILDLEREKIFNRSWVYVGHESEVRSPHDFRTRDVAGRPVILTRGEDGGVRVLLNSCTHRGNVLCREKAGHARFLKCFYHSWSFDTSGRLVALPDDEAYGPGFERDRYCLASPAQVESYRGFIFATFDPAADDLVTYLAGARPYLDLVADQSEDGMEILRGTHEYSMRANWKLLVENSIDGYHAMSVHQRYIEMVFAAGMKFEGLPLTRGADLGNGHAVAESVGGTYGVGRPLPNEAAERKYEARRAGLRERFGEAWTSRMYGTRNVLIFPNLVVIDLVGGIVVRRIDPIRPDYIEVSAWELAPIGEDPELRAARLDNFLTFWGPGGFATPDDVEALEGCQRGFKTLSELAWSDISRGMHHDVCSWNDELQMRAFWRRWNALVGGGTLAPEPHSVPAELAAERPMLAASSSGT